MRDCFRLRCRSEEHTSELQSRSDLVCRLLLEKKKTARCSPRRRRHSSPSTATTPSPAFRSPSVNSCRPRRTRPASSCALLLLLACPPPPSALLTPVGRRESPVHPAMPSRRALRPLATRVRAAGLPPRSVVREGASAGGVLHAAPSRALFLFFFKGSGPPRVLPFSPTRPFPD